MNEEIKLLAFFGHHKGVKKRLNPTIAITYINKKIAFCNTNF